MGFDNDNKKVVLYFMRHGETIINKAGRVQGWCDGVLTEEGISVAENVALGLRDIEFRGVYSSDLGRAVKTARIIINANRVSDKLIVNEMPDLREVYFGKYEGELEEIMFKDIFRFLNIESFEEAMKIPDFGRKYVDACASLDETGQAESYDLLIKRVMNGVNELSKELSQNGGGNALVVVHGGILRNILKEIDKNAKIDNVHNSSISLVEYENNNLKIVSINDMSYRDRGEQIKKSENNYSN